MIEVNDYVRTKDGHIAKYIKKLAKNEDVSDGMLFDSFIYGKYKNIRYSFLKEIMVKHSKQLIDLIEVGDFVNGYRVINVINEGPCPSGKCVDIDSSKDSSECTLWEEDIKTILTKESYIANCYKVGGEDE